jgi:hypothetical protein
MQAVCVIDRSVSSTGDLLYYFLSLAAMKPLRPGIFWHSLLIDVDPHQSLFASLTHLLILDNLLSSSDVALVLLPNYVVQLHVLTHLAMVNSDLFDMDLGLENAIFAACKALKVFIVNTEEPKYGMACLERINDIRFVYIILQDAGDFFGGWLAQTRGGINLCNSIVTCTLRQVPILSIGKFRSHPQDVPICSEIPARTFPVNWQFAEP